MRLYPSAPRQRDTSGRRWRIDCDLAYDGGGSSWSAHYRTRAGARLAAWWHYHVASWGGHINLVDQEREQNNDRPEERK